MADNIRSYMRNHEIVDVFANWYDNNGKTVQPKQSNDYEDLKQRYNEDPSSLNPTELIQLGSYERNQQENEVAKERQDSASQIEEDHQKDKTKQEADKIRLNDDQMKVFEQMESLSQEFRKLNDIE
ncbi:hypothetical protein FH966_00615 [Lentibacillus cibarius]|uniref:Uncharacterized protein n=1 Tax=Lentibacillus cibarius TaxID=2583219 RepID=A0A549YEM1_9BACI|nr:hypothetical protein [Lentibacillus cibarius]TRM10339.1 hypothetical protein FH966_00615 [Lentibacillus cibarius]